MESKITMTTKRKATGVPKNTFRSAYNLGNENYSETFTDGITEQHHTDQCDICLLYTSPSPRDATLSRMPSSA